MYMVFSSLNLEWINLVWLELQFYHATSLKYFEDFINCYTSLYAIDGGHET